MNNIILKKEDVNDGLSPPVDIAQGGGQQGLLRNPKTIDLNARYVEGRMIPVLLAPPPLMIYLDDAQRRIAMLKSLIEDRAINISGINSTLNLEYVQTQSGQGGQQRSTVTNATFTPSEPSYVWPEAARRSIGRYWEEYIKMFIMDPDLKRPRIATMPNYVNADPETRLPLTDYNSSFTTMFITPTPEMDDVDKVTVCAMMSPQNGPENVSQLAVGEALEAPTVDIPFNAVSDHGEVAAEMGRQWLKKLNQQRMNPSTIATFVDDVAASVNAETNVGIFASANQNG